MNVKKIARLFEAHPSPVIGLHEDGSCAFANPALLLILGEAADATPDPATFLTHPGDAADIISYMGGGESDHGGQERPLLLRRPDGLPINVAARGLWFGSPDGPLLCSVTLEVETGTGDGGIVHPLLNAINEAVIIADRDRRILYANEAACLRYGYGVDEILNLRIDAIVAPHSDHSPAKIHDTLFEKKTDYFENDHITRLGVVIPVEVSTRAISYHGIPAIMSVSRDITSRREEEQTRKALLESEEKYRVLFESAGDAIFIADAKGLITGVNDRMAHMLGYSKENLSCMPLSTILAGGDAGAGHTFQTILDDGSLIYPASLRAVDGTFRDVEILSRTIPYGGGKAIISIARDVSRRKALEEQLHLSEEMYRAIYANSGVAIIILNRSDEILLGNAEAETLLASEPGGLTGRIWTEFVDDPHLLSYAEMDEVPGGFDRFRVRNLETEAIAGSGERVPCILSVSSIPGAGRYIVTLQDLRANKAMIASIGERQQLLDEIFRSAPDGFILLDENREIRIWNRGAERITGYAADEMTGTIFGDSPAFGEGGGLFGQDLRELLVPGNDAGEGRRNRAELRLITRKGEERACEMTVSFVQRENGTGTLCILRDVSRQKAILDALTRNEEYLRLVIDSADLGTWDWHVDSGMVAISPDMYDIVGYQYTAEWVPLEGVSLRIHPDDRERWERSMQAYAKGEPVKGQTEFRMKASDGRCVWFASEGSAAEFNEDGSSRRVVGILRDITEEKLAEEALRAANKKLSVLSGITRHDVLNQIQGLLFYADEIIQGDYTAGEMKAMAEKILAASETINRQISFTRNYEKLGAEPAEWQNLADMIEETKGALPPGIACTTAVPVVEVYADRLFVEVLRALFENIRTHAGGATEAAVSFEERAGSGYLVIADNGPGIPASKKGKIFAHTTTTAGNSLFLAREIAGVTGVQISETGTEGEGAVFRVAFPKNGYRAVPGQ